MNRTIALREIQVFNEYWPLANPISNHPNHWQINLFSRFIFTQASLLFYFSSPAWQRRYLLPESRNYLFYACLRSAGLAPEFESYIYLWNWLFAIFRWVSGVFIHCIDELVTISFYHLVPYQIQLYYRSIQPSPSWSCPFLPFRRKATLPWILNLKIDFNRDHFHRDQPFPEWQFLPPLFCKPDWVDLLSSFFFRFLLVLLRKKDPVKWFFVNSSPS